MNRSKNQDFGIEGYEFPKFDARTDRSKYFKMSTMKKKTYLDDIMRDSKILPAPGQYNTHKFEEIQMSRRKSELSKSQKITFLE